MSIALRIGVLFVIISSGIIVDSSRQRHYYTVNRRPTSRNALSRSWWERRIKEQGPNVCAIEKVLGKSRRFSKPWTGGSICGLPTVIRFECCEGYAMLPFEPGCSLGKPLDNLVDSSKANGATALAHGIKVSGLSRSLAVEGPFTLFAPSNHAFLNASEELIYSLTRKTALQGSPPSLLMYHLVSGRIPQSSFGNNLVLKTLYYRQPIRINKFSNGLVTVNCIPFAKADLEATNGIVHTVENILMPPSHRTVADYVIREPLFSRLAAAMTRTPLAEALRQTGPFTFFAPTDDAFEQMYKEEFDALMNDSDALTALLQYHTLSNVWCATSITSKSRLKTQEGSYIYMSCNETQKFVNDANILHSDIVTGNGFIHIIDKVLIPQKAKSLRQVAEELGLSSLLSFLPQAGLDIMLLNTGKFTIWAPSDSAFKTLSNHTTGEMLSNNAVLQDILMGHMVTGRHRTSGLLDRQSLPTLKLMHRLRIKLHRKGAKNYPYSNNEDQLGSLLIGAPDSMRFSVENAMVVSADNEARNGIIHVIDEVLIPPQMTIASYLREQTTLSTFVEALNHTNSRLLEVLSSGRGPYTVLAATNDAFDRLPTEHLIHMMQDTSLLTEIMGDHVFDELIVTKGFLSEVFHQFRTRNGHLVLMKEEGGLVTVGTGTIEKGNVICTNGIIHWIDRLIILE